MYIKENTSKKLLEEKEYKGLKIKNIELKAEGGISKLTATIENKSGEDYSGEKVNIVFENKDGTEYARLEAVMPAVDNRKTAGDKSCRDKTARDKGNRSKEA